MEWTDVACIVFTCVTMNHLGLIGKLEEITGELPILNCPKCSTFWCTLCYGLWGIKSFYGVFPTLATSFLASYMAIWLELFEGYTDTLYAKLYDKIYPTADTSDADAPGAEGPMSGVPGTHG